MWTIPWHLRTPAGVTRASEIFQTPQVILTDDHGYKGHEINGFIASSAPYSLVRLRARPRAEVQGTSRSPTD